MRKYLCLAFFLSLTACTYSVNLVHTEGTASDIVDENQTPTATTTVDAHV